jgi:hypothetical protein
MPDGESAKGLCKRGLAYLVQAFYGAFALFFLLCLLVAA